MRLSGSIPALVTPFARSGALDLTAFADLIDWQLAQGSAGVVVGRVTAMGPVPKTLRPIFRDREDFSGGHSLTDATIAALDASAALIEQYCVLAVKFVELPVPCPQRVRTVGVVGRR